MSHGDDCRIESSQGVIWEITEFLLNILVSFFFQPLFHALISWQLSSKVWLDVFKLCYFVKIFLSKVTKPLTKTGTYMNVSFGCKNRMYHHEFKLDAYTKKS